MPARTADPAALQLNLTVIVAAYQAAAFIAEAVTSAASQLPRPADIIVVDDASTDLTGHLAAAAGARVISLTSNVGPGAARAVGVGAAATEWIALLDADDVYLPGHLQRLWKARGDHVLVAEAGIGTTSGRFYGWPGRHPRTLAEPWQAAVPANPIVTSGVMVRRDALLRLGGFSPRRHSEDLETWFEVLEMGPGLVLPTLGVGYREHEAQATAKPDMLASAEVVMRKFADRPWCRPRHLAALEISTAWDTDRRSVLRHARALPQLMQLLHFRRRARRRKPIDGGATLLRGQGSS